MPKTFKPASLGAPALLMLSTAFGMALDTHHHHDPHTPRRELNENRRRRAMEGEMMMQRSPFGEGDPNGHIQIVELVDPEKTEELTPLG